MTARQVVITGLGVIASCGIGKDAFFQAIFQGISGIKPISLFDTSAFKVKVAGEIADFDPQVFLGPKGLRVLDRSIKLVASASRLALDDANLEITEENARDIGVAIGSTLGSICSVSEYHKEAIKEGSRYVNPALFPNTVINSPASQVGIKFNIKGFNATLSTGFCASLDALGYARDFLRLGRAKAVLAGGVEELCIQLFLAFYKTGCLAGSNASGNGFILGEGAGILVLEDLASALSRKAKIYARVSGYARGFDKTRGLKKAMHMAMEEADIGPADIDCICSSANSSQDTDTIEGEAIRDVFGNRADEIPHSAIKLMTGECYSASGSLQAISAVGAINKQMIPGPQAQESRLNYVLINAVSKNGSSSSLIVSKFQ